MIPYLWRLVFVLCISSCASAAAPNAQRIPDGLYVVLCSETDGSHCVIEHDSSLDPGKPPSTWVAVAGDRIKMLVRSDRLLPFHGITANAGFEPDTGQPVVFVVFAQVDAVRFAKLSEQYSGKTIAWIVDNEIAVAPVMHGPFASNGLTLSGSRTMAEAQDLATRLQRAGPP